VSGRGYRFVALVAWLPDTCAGEPSDEATRMTAQHLAAVTPPPRLALLVVVVLQLETTLTDAAPAMFDKLLGSLSRRAERRSEERAAHSTGDLRARLRTFAGSCRAMIEARDAGNDLEEAIEQHMGWAGFIRAVGQAASGPSCCHVTRSSASSRRRCLTPSSSVVGASPPACRKPSRSCAK
jgi:hypothetical protein